MDYKKAYEEMVRRAREIHESGNALTRMQMEIVCPSLADKASEKIRELLMRFVKYDMPENYSDDFSKEECLSWLEMQKREERESRYCDLTEMLVPKQPCLSLTPAEKSALSRAIFLASELNEDALAEALKRIYDGADYKEDPKEWSESDEGMLNCLIATLCEDEHGGIDANERFVTWLRSLSPRSHWKPSEAQMKALLTALPVLTIGYDIDDYSEARLIEAESPLRTLYNDLKKLL